MNSMHSYSCVQAMSYQYKKKVAADVKYVNAAGAKVRWYNTKCTEGVVHVSRISIAWYGLL